MRNRFIAILSLFVIAASLIIISVQPITPKSVTPPLEILPTPTLITWQTYRNEKYNYTFEYPSNYLITVYTAPVSILTGKKENTIDIINAEDSLRVEFDSTNLSQKTISEIYNLKQSNVKIDNLPTYFEYGEDEGGGVYNTYYFIKNKNIFSISTIKYTGETNNNLLKILSSFKFTDNAPKQ